MTAPVRIDARWRRDHPLPTVGSGLDKDARGQVLVLGGSAFVPGAVRLTAEAALRAGAGKVQVATVAENVPALGAAMPEMAMIALPADGDGEVAAEAADLLGPRLGPCRSIVLGCGMAQQAHSAALLAHLLGAVEDGCGGAVIDAGLLTAVTPDMTGPLGGRAVLTPHPGELARLVDGERDAIERDPVAAARDAAARFGAVVALKGEVTAIADPGGTVLTHVSESAGLGTAGSGDVLAGIIGGLLARGAAPLDAAGWGVWLHGEAGAFLAASVGPLGFLARELTPQIPRLLATQLQA